MRISTFVACVAIALLPSTGLASQGGQANVPSNVQAAFKRARLETRYKFTPWISPCCIRGDFNGDGRLDDAVLITDSVSGKKGIAFVHAGSRKVFVVGAGRALEGDDDFEWMDVWELYRRGPVGIGVEEERTLVLRGDAILATKMEAASGLIYWTGKQYAWYQQGD